MTKPMHEHRPRTNLKLTTKMKLAVSQSTRARAASADPPKITLKKAPWENQNEMK